MVTFKALILLFYTDLRNLRCPYQKTRNQGVENFEPYATAGAAAAAAAAEPEPTTNDGAAAPAVTPGSGEADRYADLAEQFRQLKGFHFAEVLGVKDNYKS